MSNQELKQDIKSTCEKVEDTLADFTAKTGFVLHVNVHNSTDRNSEVKYKCDWYLTHED